MFQMDIKEDAKKRGGKKTVAKSTTTIATHPERKKRGRAAPAIEESPRRKSGRSNLGTKTTRFGEFE